MVNIRDNLNYWIVPLAVTACVLLLLSRISFSGADPLKEGSGSTQLSQYTVRGAALVVNGTFYTLNFAQQTRMIAALLRAVAVAKESKTSWGQKPFFDKLVIYRFNESDLEITPIEQRRSTLLLSIPQWSKEHDFLDASSEELMSTLKGAFGP